MKKYIIANWKMNCEKGFLLNYAKDLISHPSEKFNFIICPPAVYLEFAKEAFTSEVSICAQDCSEFETGAYTGQISPKNLADIGIEYALIGHSEARIHMNQSDDEIAKKIQNAIKNDIKVIYCIGEDGEARLNGDYIEFLKVQLTAIPKSANSENIMIAYEPIWAVGSGKTPSAKQISEVIHEIEKYCEKHNHLAGVKIFYGGSVTLENFEEILQIPGIEGLLIGGMSLKLDQINEILS